MTPTQHEHIVMRAASDAVVNGGLLRYGPDEDTKFMEEAYIALSGVVVVKQPHKHMPSDNKTPVSQFAIHRDCILSVLSEPLRLSEIMDKTGLSRDIVRRTLARRDMEKYLSFDRAKANCILYSRSGVEP